MATNAPAVNDGKRLKAARDFNRNMERNDDVLHVIKKAEGGTNSPAYKDFQTIVIGAQAEFLKKHPSYTWDKASELHEQAREQKERERAAKTKK